MFCSSKPRKRRQRGGRNNARRLNVTFLPMDSPSLANGTDNGTSLLSNGKLSSSHVVYCVLIIQLMYLSSDSFQNIYHDLCT